MAASIYHETSPRVPRIIVNIDRSSFNDVTVTCEPTTPQKMVTNPSFGEISASLKRSIDESTRSTTALPQVNCANMVRFRYASKESTYFGKRPLEGSIYFGKRPLEESTDFVNCLWKNLHILVNGLWKKHREGRRKQLTIITVVHNLAEALKVITFH